MGKIIATLVLLVITLILFPYWKSVNPQNYDPVEPYLDGVFPDDISPLPYDVDPVFESIQEEIDFALVNRFQTIPGTSSIILLGKQGKVWSFEPDEEDEVELLLDLSDVVMGDSDAGLLGIAFHPDFEDEESPGYRSVFLFFTYRLSAEIRPIHDRLSRFEFSEDLSSILRDSEQILISQYDRNEWHNGGGMFFDNEGYLYLSLGDEGLGVDIYGRAQDIDGDLFSGLLRIDVDQDPDRSHPIRRFPTDETKPIDDLPSINQNYTIPDDNPWVNEEGENLEEYFAIGLRSPHSAHYDPVSEKIFVADVGQSSREEISILERGSNAQWSYREGDISGPRRKPRNLIGIDTPPIHTYSHDQGVAIIGGGVYRGPGYEDLEGKYLFGDYSSRNVWSLDPNSGEVELLARLPTTGLGLVDFLYQQNGDIIILMLDGTFYELRPTEINEPPEMLSDVGAFTDLGTMEVGSGILAYDVNTPLWSDGASKERWIALPGGAERITYSESEPFVYPPGTVFIKHFAMDDSGSDPIKLETRFLVIDKNSEVYGLTYKWNEEGSEAFLIGDGQLEEREITFLSDGVLKSQVWAFPSRSQCLSCHNSNAGDILGARASQLNKDHNYQSGRINNQILEWNDLNFFDQPVDLTGLDEMITNARIDDQEAPLDLRVRSYIDANCSFCHQPGGVEGAFDARLSTHLKDQKIVNHPTESRNSHPENRIIYPLSPEKSEIWVRDSKTESGQMPPLAKSINDEEYLEVLEAWILSLTPVDTVVVQTICEGSDHILADGTELENITVNATDTTVITSTIGLDSLVITHFDVIDSKSIEIDSTVCLGSEFVFPDKTSIEEVLEERSHTSRLVAKNSCDSLVTINLLPEFCGITTVDNDLNSQVEGNDIRIFPNPFNSSFSVGGLDPSSVDIRFTNISGSEIPVRILSQSPDEMKIIPGTQIENGIYFLNILGKNRSLNFRILHIH